VLVGVDYSQMELRAAAWISGDAELTGAYERGDDVHVLTAAAINGIAPEVVTKEQRTAAKAINFGSIYGMGPMGLVRNAWKQFGIDLTEAEAKLSLDRFFATYAGLRQWMHIHADECKRTRKVTIGAGRVVENAWEGLHGLRYTQMCNLPVQGICADCMMCAIAHVHAELGGVLVAMVHDELLAEVPEADAPTVAEKLKECLHRAFVETFPGRPPAVSSIRTLVLTGRRFTDVAGFLWPSWFRLLPRRDRRAALFYWQSACLAASPAAMTIDIAAPAIMLIPGTALRTSLRVSNPARTLGQTLQKVVRASASAALAASDGLVRRIRSAISWICASEICEFAILPSCDEKFDEFTRMTHIVLEIFTSEAR
jgi:DNA polymerase family A